MVTAALAIAVRINTPRVSQLVTPGTLDYSPPNGDGELFYTGNPQFLAPDGASSLGAIAIGLLAETSFVLIITAITSDGNGGWLPP